MEPYDYPEYYEHPALHAAAVMGLVLKAAACRAVTVPDCVDHLCQAIQEIDGTTRHESREAIRLAYLSARIRDARRHLLAAGLITDLEDGTFRLTGLGRDLLDDNPTGIDESILSTLPEYRAFLHRDPGRRSGVNHRNRYEAGYQAFSEGLDLTDNPHRPDSADHAAWSDGWSEAFDEVREHETGDKEAG